jgi:hypothetical protein
MRGRFLPAPIFRCRINSLKDEITFYRSGMTVVILKNFVAKTTLMKLIFTFFLFLLSIVSIAQDKPLVIVDGIPVEFDKIKELNPAEIESIHVLKDSALSRIGCRPNYGGMILITTKTKMPVFVVKDGATGDKLAGATIEFKNSRHTIMATSNENGVVIPDGLNSKQEYEMNITMVGYTGLVSVFKPTDANNREFLLQKNIKDLSEVTVIGYGTSHGCYVMRCGGSIMNCAVHNKSTEPTLLPSNESLYPNPVVKGGTVTIKLKEDAPVPGQFKIYSLDGRQVLTQSASGIKSRDMFDLRTGSNWAAGVYLVQSIDAKGKLIHTSKLVIQ